MLSPLCPCQLPGTNRTDMLLCCQCLRRWHVFLLHAMLLPADTSGGLPAIILLVISWHVSDMLASAAVKEGRVLPNGICAVLCTGVPLASLCHWHPSMTSTATLQTMLSMCLRRHALGSVGVPDGSECDIIVPEYKSVVCACLCESYCASCRAGLLYIIWVCFGMFGGGGACVCVTVQSWPCHIQVVFHLIWIVHVCGLLCTMHSRLAVLLYGLSDMLWGRGAVALDNDRVLKAYGMCTALVEGGCPGHWSIGACLIAVLRAA